MTRKRGKPRRKLSEATYEDVCRAATYRRNLDHELDFLIAEQPTEVGVKEIDVQNKTTEIDPPKPKNLQPYRNLMSAVMERHLKDLGAMPKDSSTLQPICNAQSVQKRDKREAIKWLLSGPSWYAFSFHQICQELGIPKMHIFEKIGIADLTRSQIMEKVGLSSGSARTESAAKAA